MRIIIKALFSRVERFLISKNRRFVIDSDLNDDSYSSIDEIEASIPEIEDTLLE